MKQNGIRKTILFILSFILGGLLFSAGILALIHPTNRAIATWKQPDNIKYNEYSPYYLSVVEGSLDISHFPYTIERQYYIYVGPDSGNPSYGHVIDFSFHPDDYNDLEGFIKSSNITWDNNGVTFEDASGHKLFIPKSILTAR